VQRLIGIERERRTSQGSGMGVGSPSPHASGLSGDLAAGSAAAAAAAAAEEGFAEEVEDLNLVSPGKLKVRRAQEPRAATWVVKYGFDLYQGHEGSCEGS